MLSKINLIMIIATLSFPMTATLARAGLINPVSASSTGTVVNDPNLVIDGALSERFPSPLSSSIGPNTVSGLETGTVIINFGGLYTVENLTVYVDNNDDYLFRFSVDGIQFADLFTFLAVDGPVPVTPGGQDILTTDSIFPTSPGDLTTPAYVGRSFTPVAARYLEVLVTGGDGASGVAEVQAHGTLVPEPSSILMFGIGLTALLILFYRRRRREWHAENGGGQRGTAITPCHTLPREPA